MEKHEASFKSTSVYLEIPSQPPEKTLILIMRQHAELKVDKVEQSAVVSFGALETNTSVGSSPHLRLASSFSHNKADLGL